MLSRTSQNAGLACAVYASSSTVVTLLNKIVFSHAGFHAPWTTLAIQNLLSVALISLGNVLGLTSAGRLSRRLSRDMAFPVVAFVLFIYSNAQSMRYISVPVLTVWKSVAPMAVALFERAYFGERFPRGVYLSMALIVCSALVTAVNDLEFSLVGYAWAAVNVLANVAYLASLRICLTTPKVSALDKTFHSNLLSLLPMVSFALLEEYDHVLRDFETTSVFFRSVFFLSGLLTTAVCTSSFWTISLTNGTTLSFVGGLNKVPMILISLLIFQTQMSAAGWAGVALGVVAGLVFMQAKAGASAAVIGEDTLKIRAETEIGRGESLSGGRDAEIGEAKVGLDEKAGHLDASGSLEWVLAMTRRRFGWGGTREG